VWGPGRAREDHRAGARKLAMRLERQAAREGRTLRVFCASMADWLDPEVPAEWLADLLALVAETPHLTWMLLTKRPHLWRDRLAAAHVHATGGMEYESAEGSWIERWLGGKPPANVWVGTTVEDQRRADERVPALLDIPARVRFLSCEPLLGPVDLTGLNGVNDYLGDHYDREEEGIDWIIAGGESGHGARPMHPAWARSLRDQAQAAGVAFHFKQWGEHVPVAPVHPEPGVDVDADGCDIDPPSLLDGYPESAHRCVAGDGSLHDIDRDGQPPGDAWWMARVGKAAAGRELDGRTWDEMPAGSVVEPTREGQ
jgi:protein gp37